MFPRRVPIALACTLAVLAGTLLPIAPATAADSGCIVTSALPAKVSIVGRSIRVPLSVRESTPGCLAHAEFVIRKSGGSEVAVARVDGGSLVRWTLSAKAGAGRYHAEFRSGTDQSGDAISATGSRTMTAKFATKAPRVRSNRVAHRPGVRALKVRVTQTTSTGRWNGVQRTVRFQRRAGSGWHTVKSVRSSRSGTATVRVHISARSRWRALVVETSSAWGAKSGVAPSTRIPVPLPSAPTSPVSDRAPVPSSPAPPTATPAPVPPVPSSPPPVAPVPPASGPASASALLAALPVRAEDHSKSYDRTLFGYDQHLDADHDGCWTRKEVLIRDAIGTPRVSASCAVYGTWTSLYDDVTTSDANDLEVDHVVPLAEAWYSGADDWSHARQVAFGNDLGYLWDLQAVTAASNQAKGAGDPADWMPARNQCTYVKAWVAVKYRWGLAVDPRGKSVIESNLAQCASLDVPMPGTPDIAVLTGGAV